MKIQIKIILLILCCSFSQSTPHQKVLYDWSGQFGYIKKKGMIFWGNDWRSNKLLFDGTWAIFPLMYGDEIMQGFLENPLQDKVLDSLKEITHLNYDQGDYGLDQFSFGIVKASNNSFLKIKGFKRSYLGNFNQYYNDSFQPLQQSYLISYGLDRDQNSLDLTIGHFNTFSGLPGNDLNANGLYDNKITTLNYSWEKQISDNSIEFVMDQFLQRYKTIHNLSVYEKSRYLNRSQYQLKMKMLKNGKPISFGIKNNHRNIIFDSKFHNIWYEAYLKIFWDPLSIFMSTIKNKNTTLLNYNFSIYKQLQSIKFQLSNKIEAIPVHPFYTFYSQTYSEDFPYDFFTKSNINGSIVWTGLKTNISFELSLAKDDKDFFKYMNKNSDKVENHYFNARMIYDKMFSSKTSVLLIYNWNSTNNYYSGGVGQQIDVDLNTHFFLFDGFMKVDLYAQLIHFFDRVNYSLINPVEMVPLIYSQNTHESLSPITSVNGGISAKVSSFTIGFKWINITEILLSSLGSDNNNYYALHPEMPMLGRQINFQLSWNFQD